MTAASSDSRGTTGQYRKAPPVGRALRVLIGLVLAVRVAPIYFDLGARVALGTVSLMLGLLIIYSLLHVLIARHLVTLGPSLGALVGFGVLVGLYIGGSPGGPFLGHGEGALAAVTFLGVSLIVAGIRAQPGCEVMAIPDALLRERTELWCIVFSPTDWLERKWRGKRGADGQSD